MSKIEVYAYANDTKLMVVKTKNVIDIFVSPSFGGVNIGHEWLNPQSFLSNSGFYMFFGAEKFNDPDISDEVEEFKSDKNKKILWTIETDEN